MKSQTLRLLALILFLLQGCSGIPVKSDKDSTGEFSKASKPVQRIHPSGITEEELRAYFASPQVPPAEVLEKCDFEFHVEKGLSQVKQRLFLALPRYVEGDPLRYHHCFYFRLLQLVTRSVDAETALIHVEFLTSIARVFKADFNDSRYLGRAIEVYRELSRLEFFTLVKPSSGTLQELNEPDEAK